ncbi:sterol carrier protein [Cohnella kolymensis]|uniref:Sterol carrier protein n=1 Tax=Cohnella kolymensis TaxID=1590652 RepID=A0ABR5A004_9BACL|nr:SCP2 sterol-binding domain-containing protein [Cohnella kolymensis]KIL34397.1 sterol carrier protein [Cohnella kolymensis]
MSVKEQLESLVTKINANPEHIQNEKERVFQLNLSDTGILQIHVKNGMIAVIEGNALVPDVTLMLSDANFLKLLRDDLNTTMAFMTGSLKVEGSIGLALKLQEIVKRYI